MKRIRVGIVGIGSVGAQHLESILRLGYAEVAAICVRNARKADALRDFYGVKTACPDYRDLIALPGLDVVHVCTPNDSHLEIARAALAAGKHVLSEKPLAIDASESRELALLASEKAKSHNVKTAVNFVYRHSAMLSVARDMISSGALGDIRAVRGAYLQDWLASDGSWNWRVDAARGGASRAMADVGSHWFDMARFLTGLEVVQVCADLAIFVPARRRETADGGNAMVAVRNEDYGSVLMRFSNGARGDFTASQTSAGKKLGLWIEIDGSRASLRWDQETPYRLTVGHSDRPNEELIYYPSMPGAARGGNQEIPANRPERWPDPQKRMIDSFYRDILDSGGPARGAARDNEPPRYATFHDGVAAAEIVDAILRSDATRSWTQVR